MMSLTLQKILNELEFVNNEVYWTIVNLLGESQKLTNEVTNAIVQEGVNGFQKVFNATLEGKDIEELKARLT